MAEWNPYGAPFNLLATGLLTLVLFTALHLLSRRFWFSLTISMGLILMLAGWSDIKFKMNGASLTFVDLIIVDPASVAFALNQPDFRWHFVGTFILFALALALLIAERPGGAGLLRRFIQFVVAVGLLFGTLFVSFPAGRRKR